MALHALFSCLFGQKRVGERRSPRGIREKDGNVQPKKEEGRKGICIRVNSSPKQQFGRVWEKAVLWSRIFGKKKGRKKNRINHKKIGKMRRRKGQIQLTQAKMVDGMILIRENDIGPLTLARFIKAILSLAKCCLQINRVDY
jgi:hypothetical protein